MTTTRLGNLIDALNGAMNDGATDMVPGFDGGTIVLFSVAKRASIMGEGDTDLVVYHGYIKWMLDEGGAKKHPCDLVLDPLRTDKTTVERKHVLKALEAHETRAERAEELKKELDRMGYHVTERQMQSFKPTDDEPAISPDWVNALPRSEKEKETRA